MREHADVVERTDLLPEHEVVVLVAGADARQLEDAVLALEILIVGVLARRPVKQGAEGNDLREHLADRRLALGAEDVGRRHIEAELVVGIDGLDVVLQLAQRVLHVRWTLPCRIVKLRLPVALGRERLMVVSVQAQLAAHIQQLAAVDDQPVARRTAAERAKRPLDLCAIRLDDGARVAKILILCQLSDERPPDLAIERLRIDAQLVVDARKVAFRHGRGEVVEDEELHADDRIDRICAAVRHHRSINAEVRLVVALDAVEGADAPLAQRLLPEKRRLVRALDM